MVAAFKKMSTQNLFAGSFQVPEQFSKAAYYVTFDCVTGTGWGSVRGKKKSRNKENSAWADTMEMNAHPVLSVSGTGVLFQQGEMGILWTHFSLEKHTSNSLNRATVILMTIQEFRKKAAGFYHMFSELLFKEIRSMLVKCLVMRLSALFCWTVSLGPCTSFIRAVFRLTKNYHMQAALVYGISLQRSRADWGHPSSVCPGGQCPHQGESLPYNFLHREEGRGGAPDSSSPGSHPLRGSGSFFPEMIAGSGRAQELLMSPSSDSTGATHRTKLLSAP